jgi:hypothetical protein
MKRTYKVRRILSTYGVIYLCIASTMATLEAKARRTDDHTIYLTGKVLIASDNDLYIYTTCSSI